MKEIEPTLDVLRCIAQNRGKPVAAVALNYNINKGALLLVGIRNAKMTEDAVEASNELVCRLIYEESEACRTEQSRRRTVSN